MQKLIRLSVLVLGSLGIMAWAAHGQSTSPAPRRAPEMTLLHLPRAGMCPLPVLPALPAGEDTSFYETVAVPHGKVEQATYKNYLGTEKRMHVYLPFEYDRNTDARYPVLYLNHGAGDDDSKWTSEDQKQGGSANLILDNLAAAGKIKPMIVVMPDTRGCASQKPSAPGKDDACSQEFLKDIIPYVDMHYRTKATRNNRAIAGQSMGGLVVLNTGLPHLDLFSELYVFSAGFMTEEDLKRFDENFASLLKRPMTNDLLRVPFYMAAGEADIALHDGQKVLALFNQYGVRNFWTYSSGGHGWSNWRRYLYQAAQIMFPECQGD